MLKKALVLLLLHALLSCGACSDIRYEVSFHPKSGIIIPAEGGKYYFDVDYIRTKFDVEYPCRAFEYRVRIDNNVILHNCKSDYANSPYTIRIPFTVPANDSSEPRTVVVEVLKAKDFKQYEDQVDSGVNTWSLIWQATQLGLDG